MQDSRAVPCTWPCRAVPGIGTMQAAAAVGMPPPAHASVADCVFHSPNQKACKAYAPSLPSQTFNCLTAN